MKRHLRAAEGIIIITLLITLLVCPGLYAAEETLPTAEEIIKKNIEAMGGKDASKKIYNEKTVIRVKNFIMNSDEIFTGYRERPYKLFSLGGRALGESTVGMIKYGSNGKTAWCINPDGVARLLEGDQLSIWLSATKFRVHTRPYLVRPYKSMQTEGIEQINGKECYKVVKTLENGTERIEYYDKNSFLIVKTVNYVKDPQGENTKMEFYYEDYKKINGILFPYKSVNFQNGQMVEEVTYEEIELNIEMPEGIFDIPEELKVIMNQRQTGEWKKFVGTWKGTVPGPDGNALDITYVFDSSEYMTGSVSTKLGGGPFYGWIVEGNQISFSVLGPDAIAHLNGTLSGDVINMIQKKRDDVKEFILKRVTE